MKNCFECGNSSIVGEHRKYIYRLDGKISYIRVLYLCCDCRAELFEAD